jgi:hypothetical protein
MFSSYTGDGTSGVYIFMAQLETGSVATSPTFTDITLASRGKYNNKISRCSYRCNNYFEYRNFIKD